MLEKLKLIFEGLIIVLLLALLIRSVQTESPVISFTSRYTAVDGLNKDLSQSFGLDENTSATSYSYIPVYSHLYAAEGNPINVAVTLSLRNIDVQNPIQIDQILYYNTAGELIREYLKGGTLLKPLETKEIFIKKSDTQGGSGANFIVLFKMNEATLPPIFETIMATETQGQINTFSSRGAIYYDKSN